MKTKLHLAALAVALVTCNLQLATTARAQGSLTPPVGAPAPVMKSLDQIEARTIVNAANTPGDASSLFIISQPGSYYLAGNLTGVSSKNGIAINANNVTLNLNGFTMQGVSGSSVGIYIASAQTNVTVRNGTINGWGTSGLLAASGSSESIVAEHLEISASGTVGIYFSGGGVVRDCICQRNGGNGFYIASGRVVDCTANNNGAYGIHINKGTVAGCTAQYNSGRGISGVNATVSGCQASNNGSSGIYVIPGIVSGCHVNNNIGYGIYVDAPGCKISGNTCVGNGVGIFLNDAHNRIEDNQVSASVTAGIQVSSSTSYTNNLIIKNSVYDNGANNYVTPNTQIVGPIITATGTIATTSPWANFSY